MDKIAANNHFVTMRKEIKKAKAMVSGNLIRKINKLKQEKEKLEDEAQKKIDDKIDKVLKEIKLLKTIDAYEAAKHGTIRPDPKIWEKVICDSKATAEQILEARILTKNNVQKCITKFRSDCKDCDEWFSEYIEYREKKRELTEATKPFKRKEKKSKNEKNRPKTEKKENFSEHSKANHRIATKFDEKKRKDQTETLHPSWESKRKEKELLKAALSGTIEQPRRITFQSTT